MKKTLLSFFLPFLFLINFGFLLLGCENKASYTLRSSLARDTLIIIKNLESGKNRNSTNYDSARVYFQKALQLSENVNWEIGIAYSEFELGKNYAYDNKLVIAINHLFKARSIFENNSRLKEVALVKKTLGDCYSLLGQKEKAIAYNKESMAILNKIKQYDLYYKSYNNLALAYHDAKEYKRAIEIFKESINHFEQKKDSIQLLFLNVNLAISYVKNKDNILAINLSNKILENKLAQSVDSTICYIILTEAFYNLKDLKKAEAYINLAEGIIPRLSSKNDFELLLAEEAIKVFSSMYMYEKTLAYTEIFYQLKDLKLEIDNNTKINNLQFEYDSINQQKEIKTLKDTQMFLLVISLLAISIVITVMVFFRKLKAKNNIIAKQKESLDNANVLLEQKVSLRTQELHSANKELITKNFEITEALFKGQTIERKRVAAELHDNLGSTLSAVKWRLGALNADSLIPKEREIYEGIKAMMGIAYDEVRNISHNLIPQELEEKGLIGALEYLLKNLSIEHTLKFKLLSEIKSNKPINPKIEFEIYSSLLELINNILKHSKATKATIEINIFDHKIIIKVIDNGIGLKESDNNGHGIKNIKNRISNMSGEYFINTANNSGTEISINIPLN